MATLFNCIHLNLLHTLLSIKQPVQRGAQGHKANSRIPMTHYLQGILAVPWGQAYRLVLLGVHQSYPVCKGRSGNCKASPQCGQAHHPFWLTQDTPAQGHQDSRQSDRRSYRGALPDPSKDIMHCHATMAASKMRCSRQRIIEFTMQRCRCVPGEA